MDVSYPAILIGTLIHGMLRLKKAHMMAYDKQVKDYNDVRRGSNPLRRDIKNICRWFGDTMMQCDPGIQREH
jgi:hypothetical protein